MVRDGDGDGDLNCGGALAFEVRWYYMHTYMYTVSHCNPDDLEISMNANEMTMVKYGFDTHDNIMS